jgi:hypothetical protein
MQDVNVRHGMFDGSVVSCTLTSKDIPNGVMFAYDWTGKNK